MRTKWLAIIALSVALAGLIVFQGPRILNHLRYKTVAIRTETLLGYSQISRDSRRVVGLVRIWDLRTDELIWRSDFRGKQDRERFHYFLRKSCEMRRANREGRLETDNPISQAAAIQDPPPWSLADCSPEEWWSERQDQTDLRDPK